MIIIMFIYWYIDLLYIKINLSCINVQSNICKSIAWYKLKFDLRFSLNNVKFIWLFSTELSVLTSKEIIFQKWILHNFLFLGYRLTDEPKYVLICVINSFINKYLGEFCSYEIVVLIYLLLSWNCLFIFVSRQLPG